METIVGAACLALGIAVLVVASIGAFRFSWRKESKRLRNFMSEPYGILAILFIGGFIILGPVSASKMFHAGHDSIVGATWFDWLATNLYADVQALVMQNDLLDYVGAIMDSPDIAGFPLLGADIAFKTIYAIVLFLYMVVLPVSLAFFAFDAVFNGLKEFILCWMLHRSDVVYVFNGANDAGLSLSESIISDHETEAGAMPRNAKRPPLLVFCLTGNDEEEKSIESVKDAAHGHARVLFTKVAFDDIPGIAFKTFHTLKTRRFFHSKRTLPDISFIAVLDDCNANVNATIRVTDSVVHAIELQALDAANGDISRLLENEDIANRYFTLADDLQNLMHFVCLQDNPDDDLVFDTLWERHPSKDVVRRAKGADGQLDASECTTLKKFNKGIRERMEVHLISAARKEVYDALTEHPLYDVLQQVDLTRPELIPHQLLVVLVAGLGDRGVQALLAAYWAGRLPGVELRIVAIDKNASAVAETLAASYPAVLEEQTAAGEPTVYPHGAGIGAVMAPNALKDPTSDRKLPTVRFCEMNVQSSSFNTLLQGGAIPSFAFDPHKTLGSNEHPTNTSRLFTALPEEPLVPADAHVYSFISLDDDGLNLNCALNIQRQLLNRVVDAEIENASRTDNESRPDLIQPPCSAIIAPRIRSSEIMESISHLSDSKVPTLTIHPFGSLQATCTREKMLDSQYERLAIQLCGAYNSAGKVHKALASGKSIDSTAPGYATTLRAYNSCEVEKLSNRSAARFLPYRLWTMGYAPERIKEILATSNLQNHKKQVALEHEWFQQLGLEVLFNEKQSPANRTVTFRNQETDLFTVACKFVSDGKANTPVEQFIEDEEDYRRIFPTACLLGDIEHARWTASYETFGWRPLQSKHQEWAVADVEQFIASNETSLEPAKKSKHKSRTLKRHTYMAMPARDLLERGERYDTDPYAYDRIINAYTMRILQERVTKDNPKTKGK